MTIIKMAELANVGISSLKANIKVLHKMLEKMGEEN